MRILVGQPIHEEGTVQLANEAKMHQEIDMILYPEGYLSNEIALEDACKIAKENNVMIITSYRKEQKDRAIVINNFGEIIYERAKTSSDEKEELVKPYYVHFNEITIGYLLCMEILKGTRDLRNAEVDYGVILHPIGVGMFSEDQYEQWLGEARNIAKMLKTIVIGTSHADGSYRNCGTSIPISYCVDSEGEPIYQSKSDVRTRIVDLKTKAFQVF